MKSGLIPTDFTNYLCDRAEIYNLSLNPDEPQFSELPQMYDNLDCLQFYQLPLKGLSMLSGNNIIVFGGRVNMGKIPLVQKSRLSKLHINDLTN